MTEKLLDKVLGCIIGAAIGDAVGGPVEFKSLEFALSLLDGKEWVEDMVPYKGCRAHPLGVWVDDAPSGTGTDDTRLNHIFIECVIKNKGYVNPYLLALEYIYQYQNLEKVYPEKYWHLAESFLRNPYMRSCAFLGINDPKIYHGLPLYVVRNPPGFPSLIGLISLQSAGLLYPNEPEKAYKKAYELSLIMDIGFAHDATALLAATVSTAMGEIKDVDKLIETAIKTNPFGFKNRRIISSPPEHNFIGACHRIPTLLRFFEIADNSRNERELMLRLARECECLHPFDPLDCIGIALTVIRYHKGEPVHSILTAANHRRVNENGRLIRFRDVDCIAGVAGAIVGAINGLSSFPKEWVKNVIQANRRIYNIDIEKKARNFYKVVYQ